MVCVSDAPKLPSSRRWRRVNRLGRLDILPIELLYMILGNVDFLYLTRLVCTSRQGQNLVTSFPAYVELILHAPETLAALSKMRILRLHRASALRSALHSDECSCCGSFGAFLFLLSCERCCFECISSKQALWALPRADAGKCFNLSAKQLKALPSARNLPGKYCVLFDISRSRPLQLVSVRATKELALQVHGSEAALMDYLQTRRAGLSEKNYFFYRHLQRAQLVFPRRDPRMVLKLPNTSNDLYNGMRRLVSRICRATKRHLTRAHGAEAIWQEASIGDLTSDDISLAVPEDDDPTSFYFRVAFREWSRTGFLAHARSCYGLRAIEERLRAGTLDMLDILDDCL
jgi:hypothetical protein